MTDPMDLSEPIQEPVPGKTGCPEPADGDALLPAGRDLVHDEHEIIGAQDETKRLAQLSQLEYEQRREQAAMRWTHSAGVHWTPTQTPPRSRGPHVRKTRHGREG